MGSSSAGPSGYKYFMGLHMGVCRGPVDEMVEIKAGDRTAWRKGVDGIANGSCETAINNPNLFGGDKKEGGLVGSLNVMMGEESQVPPAVLETIMPGLIPGFRGVFTLFYNGQIAVNNPYPKAWTVRVRRTTKGWQAAPWYPEKAAIWLGGGDGSNGIKAMNPAHIIYELNTNKDWGRGLATSRIDAASFTAAADVLHAEGFGLCLPWLRQESLADFQQRILDHIGGMCGPDPNTGKIRLRLIRGDYDPAALPLFTYGSGLLGLDQEETGAAHDATNELMIKWVDPLTGNECQTAPVQNLASIQSLGVRNTSIRDYPGLPTASLALRVAQRDLKAASPGLRRFKIRLDRRAYWVQPGDVFRIAAPERGIANVVLRAGDVREESMTDGTITVVALIDVFGLPATATVEPQPPLYVPPDQTPVAVAHRRLIETPYALIAGKMDAANLAILDPLAGYALACAVRPSVSSWSFQLMSRTAGASYQERSTGYWCPTGLTLSAHDCLSAVIPLTDTIDLDFLATGRAALWDNEIVRVDSIDLENRTVTVGRGCMDTVPAQHAAGSRLWFFDDLAGADPTPYLMTEIVDVKLLTITSTGQLSEADAPANSVTMNRRQSRPYPPGKFRINGSTYPPVIMGALSLSWSHRNRLTQADQLIDNTADSILPESGTVYEVKVFNAATGVLKKSASGITGSSWTDEDAPSESTVRVTIEASRDGLTSWQKHEQTVDVAGFGLSFGKYFGGI